MTVDALADAIYFALVPASVIQDACFIAAAPATPRIIISTYPAPVTLPHNQCRLERQRLEQVFQTPSLVEYIWSSTVTVCLVETDTEDGGELYPVRKRVAYCTPRECMHDY